MKTYALVPLGAVLHMTNSMDHVREMQAEAEARGETLILVKPMQTIIDVDRSEAMRQAIERGAEARPTDPWSTIMSAIDDLRSAVADLTAEVTDSSAKFKAIADKLAATPAGNDEEIKAITAEIRGITAALDSATADAKAAAPAEPEAAPSPTDETPPAA